MKNPTLLTIEEFTKITSEEDFEKVQCKVLDFYEVLGESGHGTDEEEQYKAYKHWHCSKFSKLGMILK